MYLEPWLRASVLVGLVACHADRTAPAGQGGRTVRPPNAAAPTPGARPVLILKTSSGANAPWAVVEAKGSKGSHNAKESSFFKGDEHGHVELDLPPGDYDVWVTAPSGYARERAVSVRSSTTMVLREDCDRTTGQAGGDIQAGDFVWFLSTADGAYFGALVSSLGGFAACLPSGAYLVEAHEDELAPPFVVDSGSSLSFDAFSPAAIDAAPPAISRLEHSTSIASLLGPEVRVVGIGEANHGAREFLRLRLRESLELVRTRNVDFIAIEAGPAEVFPLDDYINGRRPDVKVPVSKLGYWMWDTEDMHEVLAELRAYNRRAGARDRVSLVGIDVQRSDTAARYVLGSLPSLSTRQVAALEAAAAANAVGDIPPSSAADFVEDLAPLTASRSPAMPLRMALALEQVIWRLRMHAAKPRSPQVQRELGMAAVLSMLLRYEETSRVVIWAHNTHVSTDASSEYRPLGSHLRKDLGSGYASVGILMGRGTFRAWDPDTKIGVIEHTVTTPPTSSLEAALAPHVSRGNAFLRLSDVNELEDWLRVPHRAMENGGVMVRNDEWSLLRHTASFDIVGFVAEVTPTTPTATGIRRAASPRP